MPAAVNLSLLETPRAVSGEHQTVRTFLDFVVGGQALYPVVLAAGLDLITSLVPQAPESAAMAIERLLIAREPDVAHDRVALYVCPECADLGCGAITVNVNEDGGVVRWQDWGYQNSYEADVLVVDGFADVEFDAVEYRAVLRAEIDRLTHGS